jgi:hypothetical protein
MRTKKWTRILVDLHKRAGLVRVLLLHQMILDRGLNMKSIVLSAMALVMLTATASAATLQECRKKVIGPYISSMCRGAGASGGMNECVKRIGEQMRPQIQACVKGR